MNTLVMLLALYTGGLGPSFALMATAPPHDSQAAFDYACELLDYDCSNLSPPEIQWAPIYSSYGALGMYDGSDAIIMDIEVMRFADRVMLQSVLAHEITHYIDVKLGHVAFPFTKESVCKSEFNAWRVGNAYVVANGRPDLASFDWHVRYGCFQ